MPFTTYVSFKGSKQGQFKGESDQGQRSDKWTEVASFQMQGFRPINAASGHASAQRQHHPIVITKTPGVASPQLFIAHWSNEVLEEMVIEIVGSAGKSKGPDETVAQRITLTNATISSIEQVPPGIKQSKSQGSGDSMQAFGFACKGFDIETFK